MVVVAVGCVSIQFIKLSIPIRFRNNIYTMHVCGMRIGNAQSSTGLPGKTNIGFRSDQGRPANGKPAHSVPLPGPTRLPKFSVNTHRHVEFGRTCNLLVHGKQLCVQSSRLRRHRNNGNNDSIHPSTVHSYLSNRGHSFTTTCSSGLRLVLGVFFCKGFQTKGRRLVYCNDGLFEKQRIQC